MTTTPRASVALAAAFVALVTAAPALAGGPDGVVEAVEHRHADILAVQWHPEDRHATSTTDAALFADLVDRAAKRQEQQ